MSYNLTFLNYKNVHEDVVLIIIKNVNKFINDLDICVTESKKIISQMLRLSLNDNNSTMPYEISLFISCQRINKYNYRLILNYKSACNTEKNISDALEECFKSYNKCQNHIDDIGYLIRLNFDKNIIESVNNEFTNHIFNFKKTKEMIHKKMQYLENIDLKDSDDYKFQLLKLQAANVKNRIYDIYEDFNSVQNMINSIIEFANLSNAKKTQNCNKKEIKMLFNVVEKIDKIGCKIKKYKKSNTTKYQEDVNLIDIPEEIALFLLNKIKKNLNEFKKFSEESELIARGFLIIAANEREIEGISVYEVSLYKFIQEEIDLYNFSLHQVSDTIKFSSKTKKLFKECRQLYVYCREKMEQLDCGIKKIYSKNIPEIKKNAKPLPEKDELQNSVMQINEYVQYLKNINTPEKSLDFYFCHLKIDLFNSLEKYYFIKEQQEELLAMLSRIYQIKKTHLYFEKLQNKKNITARNLEISSTIIYEIFEKIGLMNK